LQARRQKLREQWSARKADAMASRRYDRGQTYRGEVLTPEPVKKIEKPAQPKAEKPARQEAPREGSHIDQLLQAKRKKTGSDQA
jgi:hypothetical protein